MTDCPARCSHVTILPSPVGSEHAMVAHTRPRTHILSDRSSICVRVRWMERWRGLAAKNGSGSVVAFFADSSIKSTRRIFYFHMLWWRFTGTELISQILRKYYKFEWCQELRLSPIFVLIIKFNRPFYKVKGAVFCGSSQFAPHNTDVATRWPW